MVVVFTYIVHNKQIYIKHKCGCHAHYSKLLRTRLFTCDIRSLNGTLTRTKTRVQNVKILKITSIKVKDDTLKLGFM